MSAADEKGAGQGGSDVGSAAELFARAYEIEVDAEARYLDLADQMEVHNNPVIAALFRKFAGEEARHAAEIAGQMRDMGFPVDAARESQWSGPESPEVVDMLDVHYRMTTYHALELALAAEKRAFEFFDQIARQGSDEEIRRWAKKFAEEEAGHVRYIAGLLQKEEKPDDDWAEDFDPPSTPE